MKHSALSFGEPPLTIEQEQAGRSLDERKLAQMRKDIGPEDMGSPELQQVEGLAKEQQAGSPSVA